VGEPVEEIHVHLLVLGVRGRGSRKGLVGGEVRQSGSVVTGEVAPAVLGAGFWAPEHHRAAREVQVWLDWAMWVWGGRSTASLISLEQWRTAEEKRRFARETGLGFYL